MIADDLVVIGQGRIVAQGTKAELLATAGTLVRTPDVPTLARRARRRRPGPRPAPPPVAPTPSASRPTPTSSGRSRSRAGVALVELRAADGAGLEEMFLELTADTQREGAAA